MKFIKYLLLIVISFTCVTVYAKEDLKTLYFVENKDIIYYDKRDFNKDIFSYTIDLFEPEKISNEIYLNNRTDEKIKLYFLVSSKEENGTDDGLLDHLILKLTYDDKVVFEGSTNIFNSSKTLQENIPLGVIKGGETKKFKYEISLDKSYKKGKNNSFAYINWYFYTQDSNKTYKQINELTSDIFLNPFDFWAIGIIGFVVAIVLFLYFYLKIFKNYEVEKWKEERALKKLEKKNKKDKTVEKK